MFRSGRPVDPHFATEDRDPALVARARGIRGRLTVPAESGLASDELHSERQLDKGKEARRIHGYQG
jgi:hypothetical protein